MAKPAEPSLHEQFRYACKAEAATYLMVENEVRRNKTLVETKAGSWTKLMVSLHTLQLLADV